jgi:hypothetical protein
MQDLVGIRHDNKQNRDLIVLNDLAFRLERVLENTDLEFNQYRSLFHIIARGKSQLSVQVQQEPSEAARKLTQ